MKEPVKAGLYKHPWDVYKFPFYPDHIHGRSSRLIDLRITKLPFDDRQNILRLMDAIGVRMMENLAEEKDGFPAYRSMGYNDTQIKNQKKKAIARCRAVNEYMEKVGRAPVFTHLEDTYLLAWEYYELMRYQDDEAFVRKYR